ncbi:hypothetical protein PAE9249_02675 [Paenibacillus sp. CECT 9249]|uniref:glycerophosphodiester phosphodiesterase family protein n=1 Tax=Paenibacillus sp. CECT 9249 TaxID=2845385 RepID=UPI001E3DB9A7|nr:glycerophosphodiester phosphodiesterase family protein [Paenibacillus sp. CECT 9249]CAH0120162.1 hypothetical protein PAE9249_02675 [Paenibacillus sp. CECT 9249]
MKSRSKYLAVWIVVSLLWGTLESIWLGSQAEADAAETDRKTMEVRQTATPPVIDGSLDESLWTMDQPLNARLGEGNFQDARFGLLWDYKYLYIGVEVKDDTLIHNGSGYWFDQDNINLFFDPTLHQSAPFAEDDMQLGFVYQPGTTTPEFHFGAALNNHSGKDEKKILRAIRTTGDGWSLEAAVPWDMLRFDPATDKRFGMEIGATDRYGTASAEQRSSYWSAYNETSFWNNTAGYGMIHLIDGNPVSGQVDPILLEDNFDGIQPGEIPYGWLSDTAAGSPPFSVVQDTYGNGMMTFDGNAAGKQSRIFAPVQWDDYTIEADVRFEKVLNGARWASLIFRAASNGKPPYNQMAVRQNGAYEIAYRKPDGAWSVPVSGTWSQPLALGSDYTMKVRVVGNNVKEYIKKRDDEEFTLLVDRSLNADLLERGKIGFQADQSTVSFDNLKVTRITAERLDLAMPDSVEALTGPISVTGSVYYSDGLTEPADAGRIKLYSSDESVFKIVDGRIYPLKPGTATVTAVYSNASSSRQIAVTPSASGAKVIAIKHEEGYVLAQSGEAIDLNAVSFEVEKSDFTSGVMLGGDFEWASDSADVRVENGELLVMRKGVYPVQARKDDASVHLLIVAKDPEDAEYVLYEENFDQVQEGTLPEGWTRIQGSTAGAAGVKSGAFEMNAAAAPDNPSRVLLPAYLGQFGNYQIEADVTHLAANDASRWHSIMYRVQNDNYPYYQMAVRQNATAANGVEFAERTPSNQWNVMDRGSHTERIDAGKMYRYTVIAYENRVQEFIDGRLIVDTDMASAYAKGRIGLQADGSKMKVDNIRVSLRQDPLPPMKADRFVQVTEPETKISMAPTVVKEIGSLKELSDLNGTVLPATVVLHVNEALNVTDPAGRKEIGSLEEALDIIAARMIPAFYVKDEQTVDRLTAFLDDNGLEDAFVMSADGDLVHRARTAYPIIRGIVDFTGSIRGELSRDDLLDIRRKTNASLSKIALLPQSAASADQVAHLQQRLIAVWVKEDTSQANSELSKHRLITAGANGIVTGSPDTAFAALRVYANQTTLVRKPYIIGHRGMPSVAPENTIVSNRLGLEAGADFIENDMFLSKDGHLVIVHDATLDGTTNGTGRVEDYTLAELKKLNANKPFPEGYPFEPIPTLDEQIDLALEKGKMVFAEIKTNTPEAVDAFVKVIREKGAEDAINAMSFDANQLRRLAELMPEMPSGILAGGYANESNVNKSLRETLKLIQPLNATFNTSYGGLGKNFMEAAKHRGILISPWTFNNKADFIRFFELGAWGITTDYAYWASDWAIAIRPEQEKVELKVNDKVALSAVVESYKGDRTTVVPEIVVVDGHNAIDTKGGEVIAKKPGTAYALLRYTAYIDGDHPYDIYTQPIAIQVKGQGSDGGNNGGGNGGNNGGNNGNSGGTGSHPQSGNDKAPDSGTNGGSGDTGAQPAGAIAAKDGKVDASELKESLQASPNVEVTFSGERLELPAAGLLEGSRKDGRTLFMKGDNGSYVLPLSVLKWEDLERRLNEEAEQLTIRLTFGVLTGSEDAAARAAAEKAGGTRIGDAYKLQVEAVNKAGKAVPVAFGSTYVSRTIVIDGIVDPGKATGALYDPATQQIRFVPTVFAVSNGQTIATLKHQGNGIYMIVEHDKSFADMARHWARQDVEMLANKLVAEGRGGSRFDGDRSITRAEFAALLVRALSLEPDGAAATDFRDVAAAAWYAEDVSAAAAAGLVNGYADGTFRPDQTITREELAAMTVRALSYIGVAAEIPAAQQADLLGRYKDAGRIGWAKAEIAGAIEAGLIQGMANSELGPDKSATRAQSAVMLKRLLSKAGFIN